MFTKRLREGVRRGEITCSVRIWMRPQVKVGGRYRMDEGEIEIDSIKTIGFPDITPELARVSGFLGVLDLLRVAKHGKGENIYLVRFHYVPAVRALVALDHHDAAKAIQFLQANVPYELGSPQSSFDGFYGVLYPVYVRGLAYLMLHRGADAASEFRKILDHPGIVANDPIGALARLQLGRAYVQAGDLSQAKAAYRNFLDLWKYADRDIPLLKQAQLEFSRL